MDCIRKGKEVIRIEASAVKELEKRINKEFKKAVDLIYNSKGRLIISGVGKSGLIGKKIAATFSSTGTASVFLHSSDGIHGDSGVVRKGDVVICISKSGNNDELNTLLPILKHVEVPIIAITGNPYSNLAKFSDVILDVSVKEEACPNDLTPTASTTATLAMGDALAMAVLEKRNFSDEDFAFLHPGGALGKKLLLKIDDIMYTGDFLPIVRKDTSFKEIILEMNAKRFGCTIVLDEDDKLCGIITDGDLKRIFQNKENFLSLKAEDVMSKNPKTIKKGNLAIKALNILKEYNIMQLVIVDNDNRPAGMIHLHDLLKEGIE
ncbi:D-arabinose 5-phosphate isomerase [candidate division KSB1 bacterium]|nr:MAG: D-arabinose 5-phosphate isomerase [candidate division KSB1 bacterium]